MMFDYDNNQLTYTFLGYRLSFLSSVFIRKLGTFLDMNSANVGMFLILVLYNIIVLMAAIRHFPANLTNQSGILLIIGSQCGLADGLAILGINHQH